MLRSVHDRAELASLLRRDPELLAYQLGDLDDFFWPYTTWYRLDDTVGLVYHGGPTPVLLVLDREPEQAARLVTAALPVLPARFDAHLTAGAEPALDARFTTAGAAPHRKLALRHHDRLDAAAAEGDVLGPDDLPQIRQLYTLAYPGNWFDARMLETGHYLGLRRDGRLVAVAGVHVWSPGYGVAALGNVTTHPDRRGRGLGTAVVAALCRRLRGEVGVVALNVAAGNTAAVALYARLGFVEVGRYTELTATARR